MKAIIKIEKIGFGDVSRANLYHKITECALGSDPVGFKLKSRGWVAQIVGIHVKYKYDRLFLSPSSIDYSGSSSSMNRGVYHIYVLDEGKFYDVSFPCSWSSTDRYFCRVINGVVEMVSKCEVDEWLKNI